MLVRFPNLPTRFVGRTRELADLAERLANPDCRLLTLTGAGGSGKTRLAIEACRAAASTFGDGAVFVGLQPLVDSSRLVPAIAYAAGFSFYRPEGLDNQLFDYFRGRSYILLLDNFEHLIDGAAVVRDLLAHASLIKIVVTSRVALNLQEEWLYPVTGMGVPPSSYSTSLEDYEAVQLFLYLARRVQPDFELDPSREAVIRICQVANGLPLAIELAASWLKGLSVADIAREMQSNLDFLSTKTRDVQERHRSIRAAFDQSWKLLTEDERLAFARLSVFRDGFDRLGAEQITGASLPTLSALVEKSLLNKQFGDRWNVHELLRQYGEEQLAARGLLEDTRAAHCNYYATFLHHCETALRGPDQLDTLTAIEADFENLRLAWNWAIQTHQHGALDQMLDSLYQFGFVRSRYRETQEMFDQVLQETLDERLLGRLLVRRWGYLHWWPRVDYDRAFKELDQALAIATAYGDRFEIAFCTLMLAYARLNTRDNVRARRLLDECLALFGELNEPFYESWALHRIGYACLNDGDVDQCIEWTEKSLALARTTPNLYALGNCLYNLAAIYLLAGNYSQGSQYADEALLAVTNLGNLGQIAHTMTMVAFAAFFHGDFDEAQRLGEEAQRRGKDVLAPIFVTYPLALLILLACREDDYAEAARLASLFEVDETNVLALQLHHWSRATLACGQGDKSGARHFVLDALRMALGGRRLAIQVALLPGVAYVLSDDEPAEAVRLLAWIDRSTEGAILWAKQWPFVDRLRDKLRDQLGEDAFNAEWEIGASMSWDAVLASLVAEFEVGPAELRPLAIDEPLTQREIEVLRLLAKGFTNSEIAETLVIGVGTVKTHAQNIYGKLAVGNRTQAIVRAQELGLLP